MRLIGAKSISIIVLLFLTVAVMVAIGNNLLNNNSNNNPSPSNYFDYNESIPLIPPANFSDVISITLDLAPGDHNISPPHILTEIYAIFFSNGSLKIIKQDSLSEGSSREEIFWSSFNITLLRSAFEMFYEALNEGEVLSGEHGEYEYLYAGSTLSISYVGNITDGVKIQSRLFDGEYLPVKFVRIDSRAYHYLFLSSDCERALEPVFKLLRNVVYQVLFRY